MKFSSLQENLSKGLQIVTRAVPAKGPLPILSNVLITTENGRVKLSATDLRTTITTYIGASIEKDGTITVPAKMLRDFINNLSPDTINAHIENDILHIISSKTTSRFNGISSEDYPELPVMPIENTFIELDPNIFSEALSTVSFASGNDDSRPIFTGILLNIDGKKITIASTDGFRLSEKTITAQNKTNKKFTALIPSKTLQEVTRIFSKSEEPIKFGLSENENMALFAAEDTVVATRILDGQYPDYSKIIPADSTLTAVFDAQEFLEAVKLTSIFTKEGSSPVKISLDPENEIITVSSLSEETGEHKSKFSANIEGTLTEIALNSKYLLDFLGNVKCEEVFLSTNGSTAPCLIKPNKDTSFLHIIMPMQI